MVNKNKRFLTQHIKFNKTIKIYILTIVTVIIFAFLFYAYSDSDKTDADISCSIINAILKSLKWTLMAMPFITLLCLLRLIYYSGTVQLTANSMRCFKSIFAKKYTEVFYDEIEYYVVNGRLWLYKDKKAYGNFIMFYKQKEAIMFFDIYPELALNIYLKIPNKLKLIDENETFTTIDKYFKIDFAKLTYDEQLVLLKYYCKGIFTEDETGEQILSSDKKLKRKNKK